MKALALSLLLLSASFATPAPALSGESEWLTKPEQALARAAADDRPVLVFFHAPWCGWCKRMERDVLADAAVRRATRSFVALSVDVDAERAFALRHGVRGVPAAVVLTPRGQQLARRDGYVPREEFAAFLAEVLGRLGPVDAAANPEVERLNAALRKDVLAEQDWQVLYGALASGELRPLVMAGLLVRRPFPAGGLVRALEDRRLAVRLGALEVLEELNPERCDYDPWAGPAERAAQLSGWKAWAEHAGRSEKVERVQASLTAERVRRYLRELVGPEADRAARARFMLAGATRAALPVIDEFAAGAGLSPAQRLRVREVRWTLLAPPAWQARALSVAHGLVYGRLDTRTELVRRLEEVGGGESLPLLGELVRDEDPLVREAAIKALRVGGGVQGMGLLLKLGDERDPNVRTALLQNLGEAGSPRAVPLLLRSLSGSESETVTAVEALAKCLKDEAAAKRQARRVSEALRPLFADGRWRVRAALVEAAGALKLEALLPEIRAGLKDPDPFVRKLAVKTLGRMKRKECVDELFALFKSDHEFKPVVTAAFGSMDLASLPEGFLPELLKAPPELIAATVQAMQGLENAAQPALREMAASDDETVAAAALQAMRLTDRRGVRPEAAAVGIAATRTAVGNPGPVRRAALGALRGMAAQARRDMRYGGPPEVDPEKIAELVALFRKDAAGPAPASPWQTVEKAFSGLLGDEDPEVRLRAALGLVAMGREAGLAEFERSDAWLAPPLDEEASEAFGGVGGARALALLLKAGSRGSEKARARAVANISALRTPEAVKAVFGLAVSGAVSPGTLVGELDSELVEAAAGSRELGRTVADGLEELAACARPGLKRAAVLLAGGLAGVREVSARFGDRAAAMLESPDPAERRTALVALWGLDPRRGRAAAVRCASDPVAEVRLAAAGLLASVPIPELAGRVENEFDGETFRANGYPSDPVRARGTLDPAAEAALLKLCADPGRGVRVLAGLTLLAAGRDMDFSGLASDLASRSGDDWDYETREAFKARRGAIPAVFYGYLSGLLARSQSYYQDDLSKLIARIPAAERERQRLMSQAAAAAPDRLAEDPELGEPEPGPAAGAAPPPQPSGRYAVAFFVESGCRLCARVHRELERLRAGSFPGLEVREFDLSRSDAKDLNEVLCRRAMVPDRLHLVGPAVFTARGALVADEALDRGRLISLIKSAEGLPAPWEDVRGEELTVARQSIVARLEGFTLPLVLLAGLGDGVNPCAFTTILFLLSYLAYIGRSRREILITGICFTGAVFATYLAMGFGLVAALESLAGLHWLNAAVGLTIGGLAVALGALSARDGVLCLKGRSAEMGLRLPGFIHRRIHQVIRAGGRFRNIAAAAAVSGLAISVLEFGCTGQVYLPTIRLVLGSGGGGGARAAGYLLAYNAMFILPLAAVFLLAFLGVSSERLTGLFRRHLAAVKFGTAALFLVLGGFVIWQFLATAVP